MGNISIEILNKISLTFALLIFLKHLKFLFSWVGVLIRAFDL